MVNVPPGMIYSRGDATLAERAVFVKEGTKACVANQCAPAAKSQQYKYCLLADTTIEKQFKWA